MSNHTRHWRAGLLVAAAVTALACGSVPDPDAKPLGTASSGAAAPAAAQSKAPVATYAVPVAADFKLTVKVLEKKCFGSAGCNVTYRVVVAQANAKTFDPSKEYEVTYEVKGIEDSAVNTLKITGGQYSTDEKEFGSTKSSSIKLSAVITDISES